MARPTRPIDFLLVLFLLLFCNTVCAQQYTITGKCTFPGSITLILYDGDSSSHSYVSRIQDGTFRFEGVVKSPVAAELRHKMMTKPLFFYVENSEIAIDVNTQNPPASRINGSRINSRYRYALETSTCGNNEVYAPLILYQQAPTLSTEELETRYQSLEGDARSTYHYHQLSQMLERRKSLSVGCRMLDFEFVDSLGHAVHFDSVRSKYEGSPLVILFSASWCDRCTEWQRRLREEHVKVLTIDIERHKNPWSAPYMQQLDISHIPYLIWLDAEGKIVGRDVRPWEIRDN